MESKADKPRENSEGGRGYVHISLNLLTHFHLDGGWIMEQG